MTVLQESPRYISKRVLLSEKLGGVSPVTLWRWIRDGKFPPGSKLSGKISVWKESDVDAWIEAQAESGNGA